MKARLDFRKASPQGEKAMMGLHMFVRNCGLDHSLLELVKLRASQLNGCAHCIDMHTKELRADRERAALAWTEAVTLLADSQVPDDVYDEARKQFSEEELVNLTFALVAIN